MAEDRIDLNTATVEALAGLPGIGPVLAQRIVTYRETVHPFEQPGEITAVSGIGERGYQAISDRLSVAPPAEVSTLTPGASLEQAEERDVVPEVAADVESRAEGDMVSEEADVLEEELEPELEVIPPGESLSEEGFPLDEEPVEEGVEGVPSVPEEALEETTEEAAPDVEQEPVDEEAVPTAEEEPAEEEPAGEEPSPAPIVSPAEAGPARPWWRRLSWLWTAILGALLGMAFALIVWAGINGSLDVAHSRAVLGIRSDVNGVAADVEALGTDVEGLRERLEALEGLATRMDEVESGLGDLRQQASDLNERADGLEEDLVTVSEELENVAEDVASLQDQAEQTRTFFGGLQALLNDVFGEVEGMSAPTPTPTPEG